MIKRSLYFGNPAYLSLKNAQLVITLPEVEKEKQLPYNFKKEIGAIVPVEDVGIVILDHQQITITQALLASLLENNVAVITCDSSHLPTGLLLPLSGNTLQSERFKAQIEASAPLKKQLWQQTVIAKINNQAALLKTQGVNIKNMLHWAKSVSSGDNANHEARAAAYYWAKLFPENKKFKRERLGDPPNNLLNYGYAILRAIVARGLVGSGLLPTLGIHHHNKYNAYCLADDIMEPYRPFVDKIVLDLYLKKYPDLDLTTEIKRQLLEIATTDILISKERSPLMVGMQQTTASLAACFKKTRKKIIYPEFISKA